MKVLFFFIVITLFNKCCGFCTPEQSSTILNRRISEKKCDEYKDEVAEYYFVGGTPLYMQPCNKGNKEYVCNAFTGLIVGGEKTKPGEFPHMAAIGWKNSAGNIEFRCGGSLISDKFVLSVAHCAVDHNHIAPNVVRLGDQNLAKTDDGAQPVQYAIKRVIKHKQYKTRTKENDVALIELRRKVNFTKFIRPACLHQNARFEGSVVATGWGRTSTNSRPSDELMKVSLETVNSNSCFESVEDEIDVDGIFPTQICAGGQINKDTCQGDSGGPIQVSHSDASCVYVIIGMTSYGFPKCGAKIPNIYTRVSRYLPWIESIVWPNQ